MFAAMQRRKTKQHIIGTQSICGSLDSRYHTPMLNLLLLLLFVFAKGDVPQPHLPTPTLWTVGKNYTLTCVLSNLQSLAQLDVLFALEIRGPDDYLRASQITTSPNISSFFAPLMVSDGGNYTCSGSFYVTQDNSTRVTNSTVTTITVEIPLAPTPEINPIVGVTYAGSRLFINCTCDAATLPNLTMVDMSWYRDNKILLNSSHLLVGPMTPLSPFTYVKRVWFNPVMEQDGGLYSCNVTVRPMVPSSYVHSPVQSTSYNLLVVVPTVGVSLDPTSHRTLTLSPYNMLHLMCSATMVGAVVYPFNFSWSLAVNGSTQEAVTDGVNTTDAFPPVGFSSVQVTLTTPGVYVYSCSVIVSEASASGSSVTTITVEGPSLPLSPTNLKVVEVNVTSVSVTWTVPKVAFTPEVYKVRFWSPPNVGYQVSDEVSGTSDINAENMNYTKLLTGLTSHVSSYIFQVEAANTVGSTLSRTFQTQTRTTEEHAFPTSLAVGVSIPLGLLLTTALVAAVVTLLCHRKNGAFTKRNGAFTNGRQKVPLDYEIPVTSSHRIMFKEL